VKALGLLVEAAARHPEVLSTLAAVLQDADDLRCLSKLEVLPTLCQIGIVPAQHPQVLSTLVADLRHPLPELRYRAGQVLGQLGLVEHPAVLPAPETALRDTDVIVRTEAAIVLLEGGAAARSPEVLPALETALRDVDRRAEAGSFSRTGGVARIRRTETAIRLLEGGALARSPAVLPILLASLRKDEELALWGVHLGGF
jgi:hypothetical protein